MKRSLLEKRIIQFLATQYAWDIRTSTRKRIEEALMRRKFNWDTATSIGIDYIETDNGVCKK